MLLEAGAIFLLAAAPAAVAEKPTLALVGDVLSTIELLQRVDVVVKDGKRVK